MSVGQVLDELLKMLPMPKTIFEGTWFVVGWMAGKCFGDQCDQEFVAWINQKYNSEKHWYAMKILLKLLNFIHHAYIGLLGVIYFGPIPILQSIPLPIAIPSFPCAEAFWFFLGLTLEDLQHHTRTSMVGGILSKAISVLGIKKSNAA